MSSTPSPTSSSTGSQNTSPAGGNSPLLFFVALGFGVVFTNLWIIVGVKYCFRYNARNRARLNGQDDVDLQGLARPHRRRREKKLMTIDDVNERFPATKYKTWRATREVLGLPTTGGITSPEDRPPTARPSVDNTSRQEPMAEVANAVPVTHIITPTPLPVAHLAPQTTTEESVETARPRTATTNSETANETHHEESTITEDEAEEEEEAVAAVPADLANTSGDTCAICIDNLEDIDDIRGLTCGHAFHTGCLDPWLTTRRACCPLCKHDYYVPRPRTEVEIEAEAAARDRRRLAHEQMTSGSGGAWTYRLQTFVLPVFGLQPNRQRRRQPASRSRSTGLNNGGSPWAYNGGRSTRQRNDNRQAQSSAEGTPQQTGNNNSSIFGRFSRRNRVAQSTPSEPTPAQLEAGLNSTETEMIASPEAAHVGSTR